MSNVGLGAASVGEAVGRASVLGYDLSLGAAGQRAVKQILSEVSRLTHVKGVLAPSGGLCQGQGMSFRLAGQDRDSENRAHYIRYEIQGSACSLIVWLWDWPGEDGADTVGVLQTRYQIDDFFNSPSQSGILSGAATEFLRLVNAQIRNFDLTPGEIIESF